MSSSVSRRRSRILYGQGHVGSASARSWQRSGGSGGFATIRTTVLLVARTCLLPAVTALPLSSWMADDEAEAPKDPSDPNLWVNLSIAVALVLLGGAFAGLTIALMGQDETYLQVIATSGEGSERKHAEKVLRLLNKGKHWVLVTLLLSNVITNETLPIVLDRSLGGGWPAVLSSTILILIFGEVAPQSACVRYGLSIGAFCAPFVLLLMWIMCPVAWPTAKLLDWLLGKEHGTMYKKAGLKTLVQLHKGLGATHGERLMDDEVTIINSVLDLKEKPVGDIMTPMQDVFTMSADTVLDEKMMDTILSQGYSRIPIYSPDNNKNFIGMLLVKILITYDPEDARRVRDFVLATLPETAPHTSCLDIINFFQEGKSHMVLVSDFPGQNKGALGVVTLEDVIEELIGEEIIDESDVFIDVHKAIRRMNPAPRQRFNRTLSKDETPTLKESDAGEDEPLLDKSSDSRKPSLTNGPGTTFMMRRSGSGTSDGTKDTVKPSTVPIRSDNAEIREHLKHLGPSNVANKPRATKFTSVKIKPGVGTIPEGQVTTKGTDEPSGDVNQATIAEHDSEQGENGGLLRSAGKDASDGSAAVRAGYGTLGSPPPLGKRALSKDRSMPAAQASLVAELKASTPPDSPIEEHGGRREDSGDNGLLQIPDKLIVGDVEGYGDRLGEMEAPSRDRSKNRRAARSGSITETMIDVGGMNKLVLETTSSSEDPDETAASSSRVSLHSPIIDGMRYERNGNSPHYEAPDDPSQGASDSAPSANGGTSQAKRNRRKKGAGGRGGDDGGKSG